MISIIDPKSYDTLDSEKASVKASAYDGYEYDYDESGSVIYDKNGIKIVGNLIWYGNERRQC